MTPHGDLHGFMQPRSDEAETNQELDDLVEQISKETDPSVVAQLISSHVSHLIAGIGLKPLAGGRPADRSDRERLIGWLTLEIGDEIDRFIRHLWESELSCWECNRAWTLHLLDARNVLRRWSVVRLLRIHMAQRPEP